MGDTLSCVHHKCCSKFHRAQRTYHVQNFVPRHLHISRLLEVAAAAMSSGRRLSCFQFLFAVACLGSAIPSGLFPRLDSEFFSIGKRGHHQLPSTRQLLQKVKGPVRDVLKLLCGLVHFFQCSLTYAQLCETYCGSLWVHQSACWTRVSHCTAPFCPLSLPAARLRYEDLQAWQNLFPSF